MRESDAVSTLCEELQLADCERRYRALVAELVEIGFIHRGSLVRRYTRCGNPRCRCRAEPPKLHGPYWQWSGKLAGKTVSRRLSSTEAERYSEWIANNRRLSELVAAMRLVADQAITLILRGEELPSAELPSSHRAGSMRQPARPHNGTADETTEVTT